VPKTISIIASRLRLFAKHRKVVIADELQKPLHHPSATRNVTTVPMPRMFCPCVSMCRGAMAVRRAG
jgi:hypothetical protein